MADDDGMKLTRMSLDSPGVSRPEEPQIPRANSWGRSFTYLMKDTPILGPLIRIIVSIYDRLVSKESRIYDIDDIQFPVDPADLKESEELMKKDKEKTERLAAGQAVFRAQHDSVAAQGSQVQGKNKQEVSRPNDLPPPVAEKPAVKAADPVKARKVAKMSSLLLTRGGAPQDIRQDQANVEKFRADESNYYRVHKKDIMSRENSRLERIDEGSRSVQEDGPSLREVDPFSPETKKKVTDVRAKEAKELRDKQEKVMFEANAKLAAARAEQKRGDRIRDFDESIFEGGDTPPPSEPPPT